MASVSFKSFDPTQYEQFARQVERQSAELTRSDAEQAAVHFKVPVDQVLQLREKVLAQSNRLTDEAGAGSKEIRQAAEGGQQPLGTAQIKGVGVNRFMFSDPAQMRDKVDQVVDAPVADAPSLPEFDLMPLYAIMPPPSPEDGRQQMKAYLASKKPIKGDPEAKNAVRVLDRAAGRLYQLMDRIDDATKHGVDPRKLGPEVVKDSVLRKLEGIKTPAARAMAFSARPVSDLDNIGNKVAARLNEIGIQTVGDFFTADPAQITRELKAGTGATQDELLASMINPKPVLETLRRLHDRSDYFLVPDPGFDKEAIEGAIKSLRSTHSRCEKLAAEEGPTHQAVLDAHMNLLTANTHLQRSVFTHAMPDGTKPATQAAVQELKAVARVIAGLDFEAEKTEGGSWWRDRNDMLAGRLAELSEMSRRAIQSIR